jgi:hypothetical protein
MLRDVRRALAIASMLGGLAACEGPAKPPATPQKGPGPLILAPRLDAGATRTAPMEVSPIDPGAQQFLHEHANEPMVSLEPGGLPAVTLEALGATARGEAKGMEAEGEPRGAKLAAGRRARLPLPLEAGDCVTVIAHGGLGVMEVDAFIVALRSPDVPADFQVLAEDTRTGPLAIIGGQRGCFLAADERAQHAEVWVQARKGSGPVVVGIYRAKGPGR